MDKTHKFIRSDYCGTLRESDVGRTVTAAGWVQTKRDMGGVIFIDLRDREGTLQVVFNASRLSPTDFAVAEGLRNESVIAVTGELAVRDEDTYNARLQTGTIELRATALELLSQAQSLPFSLEDAAAVREELRLKYRFLDLRRPEMLNNLRFRHRLTKVTRDYLDNHGFIEVETPMLTKSTPEGARDYLVPSRLHPGTFYALPQSPQIFKQLLMVSGVDKYYQVARCFRDEDLRADRQPEFTQVDMELSFVGQEQILNHLEAMFKHIFRETMGLSMAEPFLRLTWQQAMDLYGTDKPDLRMDLSIVDLTDMARNCSFSVFRSVADKGGVVRAINAKGCAGFTRSTIEDLTTKAQSYGAKGMAWIAIREGGELYSILTKYLQPQELDQIVRAMDGQPGDFILFCADNLATVRRTLGTLRLDLGDILNLRKKEDYKFLFVTDFPQFEYSEEEKRYVSTHHPFTMPYPEDVSYLLTDPARVRAQAYDVVLNGIELGSGSIRIHNQDVQQTMFKALGFSEEETKNRFGFMINAFRYGTPPHGGFAFGLDRLAMLLVGADSLRDVLAFPKIRDASCLMTNAPDSVDEEQLKVLSLGAAAAVRAETVTAKSKRVTPVIDVDLVANLAQLALSPDEKESMRKELEVIVGLTDRLADLDVGDVEPTSHVVPLENVFRSQGTHLFDHEELLKNAPAREDGFIYVPRVVK